jgi:predicted helicase
MDAISGAVIEYVTAARRFSTLGSTTEETYYPPICTLINAVLKESRLPFEARAGTTQQRKGAASGGAGVDRPDFILGDDALFVGVFGEVKTPDAALEDMAKSTDRNDQIGRYLAQTGAVLISNARAFGLLLCAEGYERLPGTPVPPGYRTLAASVDLWSAVQTPSPRAKVDSNALAAFVEMVERSVTDFAPIADPADLAKILARQARDAKSGLPDDLSPVKPLLDDYTHALGLSFDIDDEKGDRFFRSSLVQTAFYSLFAAWTLWMHKPSNGAKTKKNGKPQRFDLEIAQQFLRIPFLEQLFHDIRHPHYLKHLDLARHLERAVATLNRVDLSLYKQRMTFPTIDGESPTIAAITYFYEPFLEAFDPELREELGVWYTPPEIVRYQVRRVHHLLKTELGSPRGLADPSVVVLDPCCGTGAYLLEVARCIAEQLRSEGDEHVVAEELRQAFKSRVLGFELLTAPFAISQLQLYMLLDQMGIPPTKDRLGIYLTNALTGWRDPANIKINFPEMKMEFDASQKVKQTAKIIVILGNPPYDRFAGVAQDEEADLVAHYKGITLVEEKGKNGQVKLNQFGHPAKKQQGVSLLYKEFGIRKQLLDDLYIRFLRLAEERIGEQAEHGLVSFISNSSYLVGRSHPRMRRSLLTNFQRVWIDNLNGDKFKTGKLIPKDLQGAGAADQSAFTTDRDPRGIQPGTAITTWLKKRPPAAATREAEVLYRDFWGMASDKRQQLLASLPTGSNRASPAYQRITPTKENRWRLSPHTQEAGYESWPALDELFPVMYQGVNHNRGLEDSVIDTDRDTLCRRMSQYLSSKTFAEAAAACPDLAATHAGYAPQTCWQALRKEGGYSPEKILPLLVFPFDQRWLYYETEHKLLNRPRPEFGHNRHSNEFLVTVPEPRKASEARPLFATTLVNLHVHERGSVVIPRETRGDDLLTDRDANLTEPTWRALREHFSLRGERRDKPARQLAGKLLRAAMAILHAPAYQSEHKSALSADWAHIPIPKQSKLFDELAAAGDQAAFLLDAQRDATSLATKILGDQRTTNLGQLSRQDGQQVRADDLRVTIKYWAGGKGRWLPRAYTPDEEPHAAWGERTGDLYINDQVFFANVPEHVWTYQLGGYPVLKKWLGYRQADRQDDNPLTTEERRWLRSIIQRIAAILALGGTLDRLYAEVSADAFTAAEIGVDR